MVGGTVPSSRVQRPVGLDLGQPFAPSLYAILPADMMNEWNRLSLSDPVSLCATFARLPRERVVELSRHADRSGTGLVRTLVEREGVAEAELLSFLGQELGYEVLEAGVAVPEEGVRALVPASLAFEHAVVPLREEEGSLHLGTSDPFGWRGWDELSQLLGRDLVRVLVPSAEVQRLLKGGYGLGAETIERLVVEGETEEGRLSAGATDLSDERAANEPTVVNLVNRILGGAIEAGATDVHFEPFDRKYRVRYRVDGLLEDVALPASVRQLKVAMVSRLKIMSSLDITEKRLPQDGRARVSLRGQEYDLRVSVLPGVHGEAVNLRLQSRSMIQVELEGLGFAAREREQIAMLLDRPHGLILVTGPTGSGKTTTLYTCLSRINKPETKIITIEDPVESYLDDVLQLQVHEEIGYGFGRALRSMLRHDPDVMLIGEIRDRETADITIRSALTGHLVFATLHTNDAAGAVSRLLDIGVEPFLVASSLSGIVAQRLVRKLCTNCKRPPEEAPRDGDTGSSWTAPGCEKCRQTGYRGRSVVAEVLPIGAKMRSLVQERASADDIRRLAEKEGMRTLRQSAILAAAEGITSEAEALRVTAE